MKTPADKEIAFLFVSHPTKDLSWRWSARLVFPPGSTAETILPIHLTDGNGKPIVRGRFEFAGLCLAVTDGKAEIAYADFIRGHHSVPLWLHRPGMPPIPGGVTFG